MSHGSKQRAHDGVKLERRYALMHTSNEHRQFARVLAGNVDRVVVAAQFPGIYLRFNWA